MEEILEKFDDAILETCKFMEDARLSTSEDGTDLDALTDRSGFVANVVPSIMDNIRATLELIENVVGAQDSDEPSPQPIEINIARERRINSYEAKPNRIKEALAEINARFENDPDAHIQFAEAICANLNIAYVSIEADADELKGALMDNADAIIEVAESALKQLKK